MEIFNQDFVLSVSTHNQKSGEKNMKLKFNLKLGNRQQNIILAFRFVYFFIVSY